MKNNIPSFVSHVTQRLQEAGFEAYLVGGCVRDLLTARVPKDWDITTNAKPEEVQAVFKDLKTVYENNFGTVTVVNIAPDRSSRLSSEALAKEDETSKEEVQVTTYRSETGYSDNRRPDSVSYETRLEKDLERRDFTMNAIAYDPIKDTLKDIFEGIKDIKDKNIKCVLDPEKQTLSETSQQKERGMNL